MLEYLFVFEEEDDKTGKDGHCKYAQPQIDIECSWQRETTIELIAVCVGVRVYVDVRACTSVSWVSDMCVDISVS